MTVLVPRDRSAATYVQRPQARFLIQSIKLEEKGPPGALSAAMLVICLLLVVAIAWAGVTKVDEVTRAGGEVVPAGSIRTIQHLEGGIVSEILVRDGDIVQAGQPLVRFHPSASRPALEQMLARRAALLLAAERLRALAAGRAPDWDAIVEGYEALKADQMAIHQTWVASHESEMAVLESQLAQRRSEHALFARQIGSLTREIELLQEEVDIRGRLLAQGLNSRLVFLNAQRDLARAQGDLLEAEDSVVRTTEAIQEAVSRIEELRTRTRNEALAEVGEVTAELAEVEESLVGLTDRVERLDVRAPLQGIVKGLNVRTVNAVVQPGEVLMEIVPLGDELVVEAQVSPRDIGHVAIDQPAEVRVTSYDFARFGAVPGVVRQISASSFLDDQQQPYYRAIIALQRDHVGDNPEAHRIIPGMTVEADIKTGSKSILDYLLKPVSRGFSNAFTER